MSSRTFARRFVQETGTTPQRWLTGQRILLAQQLLEETDETVDVIAERAGFGNAATFAITSAPGGPLIPWTAGPKSKCTAFIRR